MYECKNRCAINRKNTNCDNEKCDNKTSNETEICDNIASKNCSKSKDNLNSKNIQSPKKRPTSTLKNNFISSNLYFCVELNAHSLIKYIQKVRGDNDSTLFTPTLTGSQPCESTFRQLRSMTTTQSTVINFSVMDMLHRMNKIELQNEMMTKCSWLKFQRNERKSTYSPHQIVLPSDDEIIELIEEAKKEATLDVNALGMDTININFHCQIDLATDSNNVDNDYDSEDEDNINMFFQTEEMDRAELDEAEIIATELQEDLNKLSGVTGSLSLRDYSQCKIKLSETSPYTVVSDNTGKEMIVRKSSICWLMSTDKHSLSSDRLLRVRDNEIHKTKKGKFSRYPVPKCCFSANILYHSVRPNISPISPQECFKMRKFTLEIGVSSVLIINF